MLRGTFQSIRHVMYASQLSRAHLRALVVGAMMAWPAVSGAQRGEPTAPARGTSDSPEAREEGASDDVESILSIGPFRFGLFVDAYAAWQSSGKGTRATLSGHRAFSGQGASERAENGFALAFLGVDAAYDTGRFGAVTALRFGPAATLFHGQDDAESDASFGIDHLIEAYVLYRPVPELELDLGMFMSPFGFEALESWKNPNYTISALYVYGQPNWHMGCKATWRFRDDLNLMALVVNGANNISETQQRGGLEQSPTVGGSIGWRASPILSLSLGGFVAVNPEHNDDAGFDGFADFVAELELGPLLGALNLDYVFTRDGAPNGANRNFLGGSLTAGYRLHESIGIAARGEYLHDDASFDGKGRFRLGTGTFTVDVSPFPRVPYFIVRLEHRVERSNQRIFGGSSRGTRPTDDDTYRPTWFEGVLGVVVTTAP